MRIFCFTLLFCVACPFSSRADWPQFRGPDGQGHSQAEGIPLNWNEGKNIQWKTAIPGEGHSSPVIAGNQIWMTSSKEEGKSLRAVCVDRTTGELLHDVEVLRPHKIGTTSVLNGFASPTPVLDGKQIFVHFGEQGTVCLDTNGNIVWKNTELKFSAAWGYASSPILHGDQLILTCDGNDTQFLASLDKRTGRVQWKQHRKHFDASAKTNDSFKMSYSTPLVANVDGVDQLVSTGADHVAAYDVKTGEEIWWKAYDGCSAVARPSYGNGLFYVVGVKTLDHFCVYAIRPGTEKIEAEGLVWEHSKSAPLVPSPLLVGKELLTINDNGIATCLDAMTGELHWQQRLEGNFRASPIEVRGRIYACNQEGKTIVLDSGKEFRILATNELDGDFFASPAIAGKAMFLRSATHLYRIEGK